MTGLGRTVRGLVGAVTAALVVTGLSVLVPVAGQAGATTYASINGQGSTYAALAFQTWTQSVQSQGLDVNYTATGSPAGLAAYADNTATFAGTEAEYSELYANTGSTPNNHVARGFAYTPDVAGAISIMYHVALTSAGKNIVTYLHLSRQTIAKIFLGGIRNWDSPTITADNKGLVLPNEPITVDYRSGQSGTTALFYDFVKHEEPTEFTTWATKCEFNPNVRVWEVDDCQGGTGFARTVAQTSSDQQAQFVSSSTGLWSISYDEFGYAKVYHDDVAWVENASGDWVLPYALNIAAALQTAKLAPTTSQTLTTVYGSTNPLAYPISAYSYILYQCAPTPTRPTCKRPYTSTSVMATMAKFMRYIACTGQVHMSTIGYSPLPTQLSQFLANSIGYMTGQAPDTLTVSNCNNPQFKGGNLGVGATPPPDPIATVSSLAPTGTSSTTATTKPTTSTKKSGGSTTATTAAPGSTGGQSTGGSTTQTTTATGATASSTIGSSLGEQQTSSAPGAATNVLKPSPVAYALAAPAGSSPWPFVVLLVLLALPVAVLTAGGRRRRRPGHRAPGE